MDVSKTPRTDREVYTVKPCDIGFKAVNPALTRELERKYIAALRALIVARETIKGYEFTILAESFRRM